MYQKLQRFRISLLEVVEVIFVLNVANASKENKKLTQIICGNPTYPAMKDTQKKMFADMLSSEYNTILVIKEEMETVNFNQYKNYKE